MTLSDLNGDQHHVRYAVAIAQIKRSYGNGNDIAVANDLDTLRSSVEAYIRAKGAFATTATDQTMANLVGTWTRTQRIMLQMENKYA